MRSASHLCKKPRDTAATCENCRGPHPANFRGCRDTPKAERDQQVRPAQQTRSVHLPKVAASSPKARKPNLRLAKVSYIQVIAKYIR